MQKVSKIGKSQVQKCFAQAQANYNENALVQKKIVEILTALLTQTRREFDYCLEIGCGTGNLTAAIEQNCGVKKWDINDLCDNQNLLQVILPKGNFRFLQGDAEQLDLPQQYDLIATASTVQWFDDKEAFVQRCHQQLKPNGLLLFSTFDPDNFLEIKQLTGIGLDYPSLEQWRQWLEADFEILHLSCEKIQLNFDSPKAVLQHLKQTGVTATHQRIWTKSSLATFYENYEKNYRSVVDYTPDLTPKVRLTYTPIFGLARKK